MRFWTFLTTTRNTSKSICSSILGLSFASVSFGETPRSFLCEKNAPDGKPVVYGHHNPFRMQGYVFSDLPLDRQHDEIFKRFVFPAMDAACKANTNVYGVLIAASESCYRGCDATSTSFSLRKEKRDQLDAMCVSHCRQGNELIRGIVMGYEMVQKQGL